MRPPLTNAAQRLVSAGLVAGIATAIALSGGRAQALSCDGFDNYGPSGPLDENGIAVPVDGQPWFSIACGDTPMCTLYADSGLTTQLASQTTFRECSGGRGLARLAPEDPLNPGATYYVDCEEYDTRSFQVRDDTEPAQLLSLDSATPRRELDDGCCQDRHLSIDIDLSDGDVNTFFAEGGLVTVEFADGDLYLRTSAPYEPYVWNFPDTEEDITVTLFNANGESEVMTIRSEDFERDLAYVPCTVNDVNRGIFGLWLLIPILWIRRHRARHGARHGARQ